MSDPANRGNRRANHSSHLIRNTVHTAVLAALAAAASSIAQAQEAPVNTGDTAPIQEVVVTGSYIRRTQTESSNPVQIITADEMKASGYTSAQQVLQSLTANGQGQLSQSFSGAFAEGASGVSLRGLTVAYTLVLIDGHRTAPYPIGDDGQRAFVDVANLPFDAIDHIEVLKDGASAIYGSDAIAGVVNIILKKSYQGAQITGEGGVTSHDDGSNFHVSGLWGLGDLDTDGHNFYLSAEFRKQNPIYFTDRGGEFTNFDYSSRNGQNENYGAGNIINGGKQSLASGYILDPTTGAIAGFMPGCNSTTFAANQCTYADTWSQIQPATSNTNLTGRFTQKFSSNWTASLDVGFFESKSQQYNHPEQTYISQAYGGFQGVTSGPGVTPTVLPLVPAPTISSGNPSFPTGAGLLEPGLTSGILAAAFTTLGPNGSTADDTDAKTYRAVANLDGKIGEWNVNVAAGYTEVDLGIDFLGYPQYAKLQTALDSATDPYLVGQINSAAINDFVAPPEHSDNSSKLVFGHAGATRSVFDLSGGPLSVAFGGDYYTRDQYGVAPIDVENGLYPSGYISNNFAVGKQYVYSGYVEVDAPVISSLDIDLAGRYDHYNLSGGKASPKIGFKYTPINSFAFRGTAAKGFRAPGPQENGQAGQTFYSAATADPILCPNSANTTAAGNFVGQCAVTLPTLQGTNPQLKPETSKTFTLGFLYEPTHDFRASWDLYYIEIDNQIVSGGPTSTVRGTSLAPLLEYTGVGTNTVLATPPAAQIAYFSTSYINANSTKTSGFDLEFDYHHRFDRFDFKSVAMWNFEYRYSIDVDGTTYQLAGTHGPSGTGGDTGNPRSHLQWVNTATVGAFSLTGTLNFTSSFNIVDPVSEALSSSGFVPQETCLQALSFGGAAVYDYTNQVLSGQIPNQSMCRVPHYITFDLYARYDVNEHLNVHGSIQNVFNERAPEDWETYGGALGLVPWNPSNNLEGAVGPSFMIGATYKL
jgi:iron complex outermembrane receptor protein